ANAGTRAKFSECVALGFPLRGNERRVWLDTSKASLVGWIWCRGDTCALQRACDLERHILAPWCRDDLHRDRQWLERHRHRDDRQSDEGNGLRIDPEIGPHRKLDAVKHEGLLTDQGRGTRRRGRQNDIDLGEKLKHTRTVPAPE